MAKQAVPIANGSREDMMLKVAETKSASRRAHCQSTAKKAGQQRNEQQRSGLSQSTEPRFDPDIRRDGKFK